MPFNLRSSEATGPGATTSRFGDDCVERRPTFSEARSVPRELEPLGRRWGVLPREVYMATLDTIGEELGGERCVELHPWAKPRHIRRRLARLADAVRTLKDAPLGVCSEVWADVLEQIGPKPYPEDSVEHPVARGRSSPSLEIVLPRPASLSQLSPFQASGPPPPCAVQTSRAPTSCKPIPTPPMPSAERWWDERVEKWAKSPPAPYLNTPRN